MSECCRCIYCVDNIKYLRPPLGVVLFVMNLIGLMLFFIPHRKSSSLIYSDFIEEEKSLPLSVHSIEKTPYEGDFYERIPSRHSDHEIPKRRSSSLSHFSITMDEIDKKLKEKLGKINSYEETPFHKMIRTRKPTLFPKQVMEDEDSPVKEVKSKEISPEKEKTPPLVAPSILSFKKEKTPEPEKQKTPEPEKEKSPEPEKEKLAEPEKEKSPEPKKEKSEEPVFPQVEPEKEESPETIITEQTSPEQSKSVLEFLEEKSPESIKTIFTRRKNPSSTSFQSKHSSSPRAKKLRAGSSKSSVTSTSIGPDFEAMALTKIIRHELGYFVDKKYHPNKNETIVQNNEIEFLNFHGELLKVQKRIEAKLNSLLANDPKHYAKSLKQNFPPIKKTKEQKIDNALIILEALKNKEKRKIQKIDQLYKKILKKRINPKCIEVDSSDHAKPEPLNIKPSLATEHGNIFNGIFEKSLDKFDSYCSRLKSLKVLEGELRRINDVLNVNINRLHSIFENQEKKKINQVYSLNSCLVSELPKKVKQRKTSKKNKKGPQVKKICRRFENGQTDEQNEKCVKISSENDFFSISKVLDLLETPKKFNSPDSPENVAVADFSNKDTFWKSSFDIVLQYSDASNRIKY